MRWEDVIRIGTGIINRFSCLREPHCFRSDFSDMRVTSSDLCTAAAKMPTLQVTDVYRLLWLLDSIVWEGFQIKYASTSNNITKRLPNTHEMPLMVPHAFRLKWCGLESECVIQHLFNSTPMSCHAISCTNQFNEIALSNLRRFAPSPGYCWLQWMCFQEVEEKIWGDTALMIFQTCKGRSHSSVKTQRAFLRHCLLCTINHSLQVGTT